MKNNDLARKATSLQRWTRTLLQIAIYAVSAGTARAAAEARPSTDAPHVGATAEVLVHRGDRVEARLHMSGISVTLIAMALDDGCAGQTVLVKNERSGKRLRGTVIAPGVVQVQTTGATGGRTS